jgi:hypothetical protein
MMPTLWLEVHFLSHKRISPNQTNDSFSLISGLTNLLDPKEEESKESINSSYEKQTDISMSLLHHRDG